MLAFVIISGLFTGCARTPDVEIKPEESSPFAVYRKEDGHIIKIGDRREDVAAAIGPDELHVIEFEEDSVERVQYYENEKVFIDYKQDNTVCAIRIEDDDWKIYNGLTHGVTPEQVKEQYPAEHIFKFSQTEDMWIAHDLDGNSIEFSDKAPYIVCFFFANGKSCDMVMIQDNRIREGIF